MNDAMKRDGIMSVSKWSWILWFICSAAGFSQQPSQLDTLRIRQIIFIGNDKTKELIIRREMKTVEGERFDAEQIEADRQRIQNLRLFTRVEIHPIPAEGAVDLLVILAERWYIFPYLILNVNDRSWDKLAYGVGLAHQNLAGRNIQLNGSFWLGYNPGVKMQYSNPWITGTANWFFQSSLYSNKITNKNARLPDFQELHQGISLMLGKRWGLHTYLALEAGYRRVSTPASYAASLTADGVDHLPHVGAKFVYDLRDLHEYPKKGWYLALQVMDYDRLAFQKFGLDLRRYQPLYRGLSLAGRTAVHLSTGVLPLYERYFIGYQERIRGRFNEQSEGDQRLMTSLELRWPILTVRYFDLSNPEVPFGSYMNNLPFGLSAAVFWDGGATWDRLYDSGRQKLKQGFGLGLHFHLPYVDLLRVEYAFDRQGHPQWITDLYVWF